jgi:hypothetical protein
MADQNDQIHIDLTTNVAEGEAARKKLAAIESQVRQLKSSFSQGNVATSVYNKELKSLESQAARTQRALDRLKPPQAGRLTGTQRAGAISRSGLLGANILQDVVQGGPAAGINNILGAANDRGIKALAGEAVHALGGAKRLAAGFGLVTIAVGAAGLTIDHLLKKEKLGWGDMLHVVSNMGPFRAVGDIIDGIGASDAWRVNTADVGKFVEGIADVTVGWNKAADATRRQKEEIERSVKATRDYAEAVKTLASVKTAGQKQAEETGKTAIGQIAEAGGGIDNLANRLADVETRHTAKLKNGKDRMVHVSKLDDKGEDDGVGEDITRREHARRQIMSDLGRAAAGDVNALNRIKTQMGHAGMNTANVSGNDDGLEAKNAHEVWERRKAAGEKASDPLQDRYNTLAAGGQAPDRAGVVRQLVKGGKSQEAAEYASDFTLKALELGFKDAVRKKSAETGMSEEDAKKEIAREGNNKADDERKSREDDIKRRAIDKADKATAGRGIDGEVDDALLRESLKAGGKTGVASAKVTAQFKQKFMEAGMSEEDAGVAAAAKVKEHADKLGDEINDDIRRGPNADAARFDTPQRIASADFARSVESAGSDDAKKLLNTTEGMKAKLTEMLTLMQRGPRLVK